VRRTVSQSDTGHGDAGRTVSSNTNRREHDMSKNQEVIERVTAEALRQLRSGRAPWHRPWTGGVAMPTSLASGKAYRGVNAILLAAAGMQFEGPSLWLTYKQAEALGAQVRKGSKGTPVVFWKFLEVEKDGEKQRIPLLKTFTVFHVSQVDDLTIPAKYTGERTPVEVLPAVQAILDGYEGGPVVRHVDGEGRAYYTPNTDVVTLPAVDQFESPEGYAETLLHELTHSTGHSSRLARFGAEDGPAHFGSPIYAKEELVAELGAWMLAAHAGVDLKVEQAGTYIAGWLTALTDQPEMLVQAAGKAQHAVDRILGTTFEEVAE